MGIKFETKNKSWTVSFCKRHPLTRVPVSMRRKGLSSLAEAKRTERELFLAIEKRLHQAVVPNWSASVTDYCKTSIDQGLTEKTVTNYFISLKAHTFQEWGTRPIDSITPDEIRRLIQKNVGSKSQHTQKNVLKFIRSVFKYEVERGTIVKNPAPQMKFRLGDKIKMVLTESQARSFLSNAKEMNVDWYPHWAAALYTGLRNGELYALTWDKVNLENRCILIDAAWNRENGFKSTKSGNDRMIEIAEPLLFILKELKLQSINIFVLPRLERWDAGYQAQDLKMFLMGMRLPPIRFHDLRATWATILLGRGVEPIKVMKMGGWLDIKTMMIYARKAGVDIKGMTDCLNLHCPQTGTAKIIKISND